MKQKDMWEFFMSLIVLDAGHGGANPGATYNGRKKVRMRWHWHWRWEAS